MRSCYAKLLRNNYRWRERSLARLIVLLAWLALCFIPRLGEAEGQSAKFQYAAEIPYAIGIAKQAVQPGETFQGRLCLLYAGGEALSAEVSVETPSGIRPVNLPEGWTFTAGGSGGIIHFTRQFTGKYENWFELLQFQTDADLPVGEYELLLKIKAGEQSFQEILRLNIGGEAVDKQGEIVITEVLLPYDTDAGQNQSLSKGTLLLRHSEFDYYKNLLTGKGALSGGTKTIHPLTYMRLEWINPKRQPKLVLLQMRLLDKDSKEPVYGLISPESGIGETGQDIGVGAAAERHPTIFAELDGSFRQMMELPLYVDDEALKSGEYLLEISAAENNLVFTQTQVPVKIVALDTRAGLTTVAALILVLVGLPCILARGRLQEMKSRNLITAGLFGTTAFAIVNVPGNFLRDILHIFLGPFSFLVSGMFSGILLYMLLGGLVVLIPKFGIATLMLMVRMLINMLVFGHISPLALLIYGSQAVLLEISFLLFGVLRRKMDSWRAVFLLAVACGVADAISTYVVLQSFSFLYRLFYADWYIVLCMIVSGFIYPAVGAACGAYLGRELKKVGVD